MEAHENEHFYEEIHRALCGYFSDKLGIQLSQLNRENIKSELLNYGASEALILKIITILDECEMARYTPEKSDEQIEKLFDTTSEVINEMENITPTKR